MSEAEGTIKDFLGTGCYAENCTLVWSSLDEKRHDAGGGREFRLGRLNPPIVWSDDLGRFNVERFCVCITTPVKGRVRLLCNGLPDANMYQAAFGRMATLDMPSRNRPRRWAELDLDHPFENRLTEELTTHEGVVKKETARLQAEVDRGEREVYDGSPVPGSAVKEGE